MEVIKIKDLPYLERPREKAKHYGINKLSNAELLALIIGSGTKANNALMIANNMLAKTNGINKLLDYSFNDFLRIDGIKEATAFRFLAIGELLKRKGYISNQTTYINSASLAKRYCYVIGSSLKESMYLIILNKKGEIVKESEIYLGTNNSLLSSEKEIINLVIKEGENFFILIHNHPSGNASPSVEDKKSTRNLYELSRLFGLTFYDHIIVSKEKYYSFKENEDLCF